MSSWWISDSHCFFQHWKGHMSVHRLASGLDCTYMSSSYPHNIPIPWGVKGQGCHILHETSSHRASQHSRPGFACILCMLVWKICLPANMLWKAFISYLRRSSMRRDNKPYLISPCSLMSQLKGLVLPLSMRLAERIVCRLVNAGLWRSWSTFKMLVLGPRCLLYMLTWVASRFVR